MADFINRPSQNGPEDGPEIVNLDLVRDIDEISPSHCRLVSRPDHAVPVEGVPATALLDSVVNGNGHPAPRTVPTNRTAEPYRLEVRESDESEWREFGPVDNSITGLSCARLVANNLCPGSKTECPLHVRLVDADGETIWMMD